MSTSPSAVPCNDLSILLVDDEATFRANLGHMLRDDGHDVQECESAEMALADGRHARLLITDFSMPGQNGVGLADAIHARNPGIPVVMITAHRTPTLEAQVAARPFVTLLTKPLDYDDLHALIHRLVG